MSDCSYNLVPKSLGTRKNWPGLAVGAGRPLLLGHYWRRTMNKKESVRDAVTCLGGFLGLFLGAMLGFAICMRVLVDKVARNDGTVQQNQALLPFIGVVAAACIGAVAGALLIRVVFAVFTVVFSSPGVKGEKRTDDEDPSDRPVTT